MSGWEVIPRTGKIPCDKGMVLIRKARSGNREGYHLDLAYHTVSDTWVISTGGTGNVTDYQEWHEIPE